MHMGIAREIALAALLAWVCTVPSVQAADAPGGDTSAQRRLAISNKPWTGDFDRMVERRMIRVLVPYSRSLYFNDKGRDAGITAETVRDFETYINRKYKTGKRPITVYLAPTTRDRLLDDVAAGKGDIAAGNLTVTQARERVLDFVTVDHGAQVKEVIVLGADAPRIDSVDDLAGKTVHVRRSSSYYESLDEVNKRLVAAGKDAITLKLVPEALEDEDMMEMANAGLVDIMVVDDWKARMWAAVLPRIKVRNDVVLRDAGTIGRGIRKDSPELEAALEDFYRNSIQRRASCHID
jgi:membrane-bound lytic murein transglycosylase MltF